MSNQNSYQGEKKAKFAQAILMTDVDNPNTSKLVDLDEGEDSEFVQIFEDDVENGWTGVRHLDSFPKEDYIEKGRELKEEARKKQDLRTRLKSDAKETVMLAAQISDVAVRIGANIAAETFSYYATRETAYQMLRMLPTPSTMATGVKDTYQKVVEEFAGPKTRPNKAAELAETWSHPPNPRIRDPRDAPEGSNLDNITIIPYEPPVKEEMAYLRKRDGGRGEMEDVGRLEEDDGSGYETWMSAAEGLGEE